MKLSRNLLLSLGLFMVLGVTTGCGGGGKGKDEYDGDKLKVTIRNLYFNEWQGQDAYLQEIEKKFGLSITPSNYSWADWDSQVYGPANSDNLTDVFHFSLDNYNYANSLKYWVEGDMIKALPDDLSKYPNLKKMLDGASSIDKLKIDGKLYCIPLVKNISRAEADYSPFTYVYRRDWAKQLGVYKENDVYTWQEFQNLIDAFYNYSHNSLQDSVAAIADVEWGFSSLTNFFKDAPHCFSKDETGKVVPTYTTDKYLEGMEMVKKWASGSKKYYGYDQYAANDGDVAKQYYASRVGVFYENLSLSNYTTLRKKMSERTEIKTKEQLDDATAILKVMGEDGKYALEGTDNWFSATFFSSYVSDTKMDKLLSMMDYLLSEEGTKFAVYGIEGFDYEEDAFGNITLLETGWEKDSKGNYIDKYNGAKYLRYTCTLGYDTNEYDPLTDKDALAIMNDWYDFMEEQKANNKLRVLNEASDIKWLISPKKSAKAGLLLDGANTAIVQYAYGKITLDQFKATFASKDWQEVLEEINNTIGK